MLTLDLLNTFLGSWKILRHCTPKLFDGLPNFFSDFKVSPVCGLFFMYFFSAKLFACLSCAEEIRGQFGAPHVVENLLTLFQSLSFVDLAHT